MSRNGIALRTRFARVICALTLVSLCAPVFADPPPHAPAHGWRKKHDPYYVGYTGGKWSRDYGVISGRCNRNEIGAVLGAAVGGAIGSQVGDGSGRTVAIAVGAVLGGLIGREIGERMDDRDRACIGHALELAKNGQRVRWTNDALGIAYTLTPMAVKKAKRGGDGCRRFTLHATRAGKTKKSEGRACRRGDGTWAI